jgi:hypothetical protein
MVIGSVGVVEEGIVGLQVVGLDDEVVGGGVTGEDRLGRLAEAAGEAGLIAECADVSAPMVLRARAWTMAWLRSASPY